MTLLRAGRSALASPGGKATAPEAAWLAQPQGSVPAPALTSLWGSPHPGEGWLDCAAGIFQSMRHL